MFLYLVLCLSVIAAVQAGSCDNDCSGHGTCGLHDVCECFEGWAQGLTHMSGDCSDRVCPYDFAFVSNPTNKTKRHEYMECSARGICNRESGECECFPGYEGQACARTSCPNDCSGHGRCEFIHQIPMYGSIYDHAETNKGDYYTSIYLTEDKYYGWDNMKTRGCVCDPEYIGADCSMRMCPFGDDPQTVRADQTIAEKDQVIEIELITWPTIAGGWNEENGPYTNSDGGSTEAGTVFNNVDKGRSFSFIYMNKWNETFNTRPVVFPSAPSGRIINKDCMEFAVQIKEALYAIPTRQIERVSVQVDCDDANPTNITEASTRTKINITFTGEWNEGPQHMVIPNTRTCLTGGCSPIQDGLNLAPASYYNGTSTEQQISDKESVECGGRGKCDYATGMCECFQGYHGLACGSITALY